LLSEYDSGVCPTLIKLKSLNIYIKFVGYSTYYQLNLIWAYMHASFVKAQLLLKIYHDIRAIVKIKLSASFTHLVQPNHGKEWRAKEVLARTPFPMLSWSNGWTGGINHSRGIWRQKLWSMGESDMNCFEIEKQTQFHW